MSLSDVQIITNNLRAHGWSLLKVEVNEILTSSSLLCSLCSRVDWFSLSHWCLSASNIHSVPFTFTLLTCDSSGQKYSRCHSRQKEEVWLHGWGCEPGPIGGHLYHHEPGLRRQNWVARKPQGSLQVRCGFTFHLVPFALKREFCRVKYEHLHPGYKEIGRTCASS